MLFRPLHIADTRHFNDNYYYVTSPLRLCFFLINNLQVLVYGSDTYRLTFFIEKIKKVKYFSSSQSRRYNCSVIE